MNTPGKSVNSSVPFWHQTDRWAIKIGYEHNDENERVRAWFYFDGPPGDDPPPEVIADSVNLRREWLQIKRNWPQLRRELEANDTTKDDPNPRDYRLPIWPPKRVEPTPEEKAEIAQVNKELAKDEIVEQVKELKETADVAGDMAVVIQALRKAGMIPAGVSAPTRRVSIRESITEFLLDQQKRIDLKIGRRIDIGTYNASRNSLLLCLGCTTSPEWTQPTKLLDLDKPLLGLTRNDLLGIAEYWHTLPGDISRRTAKNYLSGLRMFLRWCELRTEFGYDAPKDVNEILRVADAGEGEVLPYDPELLKTILSDAPQHVRMYAGLGLTCGFLQVDICELGIGEVSEVDGEMYITGYRSKEDAEIKAKSKIKTTHWIPPEIAQIMRTLRAQTNPWNLYFLNQNNKPMRKEKIGGGKIDAVAESWNRVADGRLQFKQLRKWGWNQIPRHGSDPQCVGETLSKRWAGQEGGGVSRSYRFSDYDPVIAAQRKWWEELKPVFGFPRG